MESFVDKITMSGFHSLLAKRAVHETKFDTTSSVPLQVKNSLDTVYVKYVITLKFNARLLLENISVASITILFTSYSVRKFVVVFLDTLGLKARHAFFFICETSANMITIMNFIA